MKRKKRLGSADKNPKPTPNNEQETTTEKEKLGRRGFLKIGAGAAALTLANPLESIAQQAPQRFMDPRTGQCSDVPFSEPTKVDTDEDNVLRYEINAEPLVWTYVCGGMTKLGLQPVFNGALPGPSMYVRKGTTIDLTLHNKLDEISFSKDECPDGHHGDPTKPACFQHTNLHFHGLQVSPCSRKTTGETSCGHYPINGTSPALDFSSDDVLVDIFPKQKNRYKVVLPDMHAPGTNWYHSHLHGASAYQVSGGMAGALIIREPDKSKIVRQDLDKVFLLQEILVNPILLGAPKPDYPKIYGRLGPGTGSAPPTETFVNGLCRPTLKMKKGQMMRWRFINAGVTPTALMTLRLVKTQTCSNTFPTVPRNEGEVMHLIAMDGLSFYGINPQPVRYHLLGLGSRADFLVKFDQPGFYTLLKDSFPLESVTKPDSTNLTNATNPAFNTKNPNVRQVLMFVYVEDSSDYDDEIPRVIPGDKPDYLKGIWSVDKDDQGRDLKQTIKFQNIGGGKFQINGNPYPNNTEIKVGLNTAEEWTLQNEATGVPQSNTHPFHVHLNPFQIVNLPFDFEVTNDDLKKFGYTRMDRTNPDNWPFWDTIPLPGSPEPGKPLAPTSLTIRSRFLIYSGEYVTHCHILVHEDVGMMINVKLLAKKKEDEIPPGQPVKEYPKAAKECIERTSKRTS